MSLTKLNTYCCNKTLCNVVVETPKLSRNKYKFDTESKVFKISKILPEGCLFPYDFGYLPGTVGDDDDPLDVLIFMDAPAFPGCVVEALVIGMLKAEQVEDGKVVENHRIIAVCNDSIQYRKVASIRQLDECLLQQIHDFFIQYNRAAGREYKPLGIADKEEADRLIMKSNKKFRKGLR
jgi:inorganic pyrophosphatase